MIFCRTYQSRLRCGGSLCIRGTESSDGKLTDQVASSSSGITPSVMQSKCKPPERVLVGHDTPARRCHTPPVQAWGRRSVSDADWMTSMSVIPPTPVADRDAGQDQCSRTIFEHATSRSTRRSPFWMPSDAMHARRGVWHHSCQASSRRAIQPGVVMSKTAADQIAEMMIDVGIQRVYGLVGDSIKSDHGRHSAHQGKTSVGALSKRGSRRFCCRRRGAFNRADHGVRGIMRARQPASDPGTLQFPSEQGACLRDCRSGSDPVPGNRILSGNASGKDLPGLQPLLRSSLHCRPGRHDEQAGNSVCDHQTWCWSCLYSRRHDGAARRRRFAAAPVLHRPSAHSSHG